MPTVVYEIKCIIDEILDATENLTDGLLNALAPLLNDYQAQVDAVCQSQVKLLGLCV